MFVAVVAPPPQLKVAPVAVYDAFNASDKLEHVNTAGVATLALGAVMFWVTVFDVVAVQPLPGSVTVTL